jgi:hypothetical protein
VCDAGYLRSVDAKCEEIKTEGGVSMDLIIGAAIGGGSLVAALGLGVWFYWGKAGGNYVVVTAKGSGGGGLKLKIYTHDLVAVLHPPIQEII